MPAGVNDWVGLPWSEAEPLLREHRLSYTTRLTAPPGSVTPVGQLRVVGVREAEGGLTLILAHQDYRKPERGEPATALPQSPPG